MARYGGRGHGIRGTRIFYLQKRRKEWLHGIQWDTLFGVTGIRGFYSIYTMPVIDFNIFRKVSTSVFDDLEDMFDEFSKEMDSIMT